MAQIVHRPLHPRIAWYLYPVSLLATVMGAPVFLGVLMADRKAGMQVIKNMITRLDPTEGEDDD